MLFENSPRYLGAPSLQSRPGGELSGFRQGPTSLLNDRTPKEPLITKAYDAFRKHSKDRLQSDLLPTDEYIEEMVKRQYEEKNFRSA